MKVSRRGFIKGAASAGSIAAMPLMAGCDNNLTGEAVFGHGVASGDPLDDRVILWTRVSPNPDNNPDAIIYGSYTVIWKVALDEAMTQVVVSGEAQATQTADYTVKVDATGLQPRTQYFYQFSVYSEQLNETFFSAVGRTKTLPAPYDWVEHVKLAVCSCSNLSFGYFNAYAHMAKQTDLDAVLHLGDYIYEYANGEYGDGSATGRDQGDRETLTLADYRTRYSLYRRDKDLQAVHKAHPFIVVWDDHETADNAWMDGAGNHNDGEGSWDDREAAARQAYFEWMPIRENTLEPGLIYRRFLFGQLFDLMMLDTRINGRDEQSGIIGDERFDENRTLLGFDQEQWLYNQLSDSQQRGAQWRVLGQQVMMAQLGSNPLAFNMDQWDGYYANRSRLFNHIKSNSIDNLVVLTGDIHSSWANDLAEYPLLPWAYDRDTGEGALGVEFVVSGISSPAPLSTTMLRDTLAKLLAGDRFPELKEKVGRLSFAESELLTKLLGAFDGVFNEAIERLVEKLGIPKLITELQPHMQYVDLSNNGYMLLDITPEQVQNQWVTMFTTATQNDRANIDQTLLVRSGENHIARG